MNFLSRVVAEQVSEDEIQFRIDAYRAEGFEQQAKPQVVYQNPFVRCPWPGCGFRIGAVDFQIEKSNNPPFYQQVMTAWWRGPGIAACCPGCGHYVLFSMTQKSPLKQAELAGHVALPPGWEKQAYIVS